MDVKQASLKDFDLNDEFDLDILESFVNLYSLSIPIEEIAFRLEISNVEANRIFRILRLRRKTNYSDLDGEVWMSLGFIGYPMFFISSHGRVKRANYLKKPKVNDRGYHEVNLYHPGKFNTVLVHRLVGLAFIENPENKETINHKDYNRQNNHYSNLEWLSREENNTHRDLVEGRKEIYSKRIRGSKNFYAKITEEIVLAIRSDENKDLSNKELGLKFGLRAEHVRTIRKREVWKHV